jgi:hypothetical protein
VKYWKAFFFFHFANQMETGVQWGTKDDFMLAMDSWMIVQLCREKVIDTLRVRQQKSYSSIPLSNFSNFLNDVDCTAPSPAIQRTPQVTACPVIR